MTSGAGEVGIWVPIIPLAPEWAKEQAHVRRLPDQALLEPRIHRAGLED